MRKRSEGTESQQKQKKTHFDFDKDRCFVAFGGMVASAAASRQGRRGFDPAEL